jgi:DNA-binding transcriptional ArsR family regulator
MTSQEDVSRFISSSFRSVWSLELLLLLKQEPRPRPREELVTALRASDLVVSQALDSLVAAGLATADAEGNATYMPVSPEVNTLVEKAEELYARRPDAVRRMIVASTTSGVTAFADAFRLWKG